MTYKINCPACKALLYAPIYQNGVQEDLEIICPRCQRKYLAKHARSLHCTAHLESHSITELKLLTQYRWSYQLQVLYLNQEVETVKFSIWGRAEKFASDRDDKLIFLYTMRGRTIDELSWVINLTTGRSYQLLFLKIKAFKTGLEIALMVLVGGYLLSLFLTNFGFLTLKNFFRTLIVPSAVSISTLVTLERMSRSKERNKQVSTKLQYEQSLMARHHWANECLFKLTEESEDERRFLKRLQAYSQKMNCFNSNLYVRRIELINRGIIVLEAKLKLTQSLIDEYSQIKTFLEIEYETSRLAQQLPEAEVFQEKLFAKLEELKKLERQKEELTLLVESVKSF